VLAGLEAHGQSSLGRHDVDTGAPGLFTG
jgi:hypothetical protein